MRAAAVGAPAVEAGVVGSPRAERTVACTDQTPDANISCTDQARFGKCDSAFIFLYAWCLRSCNRCGGEVQQGGARGSAVIGCLPGGVFQCLIMRMSCSAASQMLAPPPAANCVDTPPPTGTCAAEACNDPSLTSGPYCLRTCNRCSPVA